MKITLYCMYDKVAQEGGPVYGARNDAVAIRGFRQAFAGLENANENDFRLYRLAVYDPETLEIAPISPAVEVFSPGMSVEPDGAPVGAGG